MKKSVITKLDIPFQCIGNMWSAIYGNYDDEDKDFRTTYLYDEMQNAVNGDDSDVFMGVGDKKSYMLHRATMIEGFLNTVVITEVEASSKKLNVVTAFPEISTGERLKAKILELCEYDSGYEARLKIRVEVENDFFENEITFWVFDTRYILNKDKYVVGDTYTFHIGALITSIVHRPKEELKIQMSDEAIKMFKRALKKAGESVKDDSKDFKVLTHDMFALNPLYDDNPEAFFCQEKFTGLYSEELHHPNLPDNFISYIFHIKSHEIDDKPGYTIPAYFNDITILLGRKDKNDKKSLIFAEGDPVDIKGVMQGYLVS